jgi:hypothetical protein
MSKKHTDQIVETASEQHSVSTSIATSGTAPVDLNKPAIQQAIKQGKALIDEGKSKADAAREIYGLIKEEPKELIVAAFVEGATLTEKGALTYWYNCKRGASKEAKKSAA